MEEKPKYTADPFFDLPAYGGGDEKERDVMCPYCGEQLSLSLDAVHYLLYKCDCVSCPNQAGFNMRTFFRYKHEPDRLYTGGCGW